MKLIIGAGKTVYDGWILTQEDSLNLLNPKDFHQHLKGHLADGLLTEHV